MPLRNTLITVFLIMGSFANGPASAQPPHSDETEGERSVERWDRERAARYRIEILEDGTRVSLTGSIEFGTTEAMRTVLEKHPDVRVLVLESIGGHIYEARGIAKLAIRRGLDTLVLGTCASACTTAFMGGKVRKIGPAGRLGFHQYGWVAAYNSPFNNLKEEQETDRRFYAGRGVAQKFLARIFEAPHSQIWFPMTTQLIDAGVVHRVTHGN